MQRLIKAGATSQTLFVEVLKADGSPNTAVTSATAGLAIWYKRGATNAKTAISISDLSTETSAWSSGGIKHVSDGVYRLDVPDAALATGVDMVTIGGTATTDVNIPTITVQLTGADLRTDLVATVAGKVDANVYTWNGTAVASPHTAGYPVVTIKDGTGTGEIDTNAGAVVSVTTTGSVTGAVASVTGNVGGNVIGSVGGIGMGGITANSIATDAIDADSLAADAITEIWAGSTAPTAAAIAAAVWTAANMTTAALNKLADFVLRRTSANVEASANGDTIAAADSLYGVVQAHRQSDTTTHTGKLTVFQTDGATEVEQITLATDPAADPVVGLS